MQQDLSDSPVVTVPPPNRSYSLRARVCSSRQFPRRCVIPVKHRNTPTDPHMLSLAFSLTWAKATTVVTRSLQCRSEGLAQAEHLSCWAVGMADIRPTKSQCYALLLQCSCKLKASVLYSVCSRTDRMSLPLEPARIIGTRKRLLDML